MEVLSILKQTDIPFEDFKESYGVVLHLPTKNVWITEVFYDTIEELAEHVQSVQYDTNCLYAYLVKEQQMDIGYFDDNHIKELIDKQTIVFLSEEDMVDIIKSFI